MPKINVEPTSVMPPTNTPLIDIFAMDSKLIFIGEERGGAVENNSAAHDDPIGSSL
jgi:hypothetical protein